MAIVSPNTLIHNAYPIKTRNTERKLASSKYYNEQFISEKRFNPDKVSKTHNLSVE